MKKAILHVSALVLLLGFALPAKADSTTIDSTSWSSFAGTVTDSGATFDYNLTVETILWTDPTLDSWLNVSASLNGFIVQSGDGCTPCTSTFTNDWWIYQAGESMEMLNFGHYQLWTSAKGPSLIDPVATPEPAAIALLACGLAFLLIFAQRRRTWPSITPATPNP